MSDTVIKVENLSKLYRLGVVGTGTLTHDINRWWHKVRGKEDPYSKIGETNVRESSGESEYVWALKDINFEVKQGEVLGIIGKNGAGKSTLLKLLSKVTGPTEGRILAKGRIASLLEVGTGFHPELTGRENIYLNGTILGMTRREVDRKLEEIVEFAGVARYVDTPVKRYSSGMKVRLGFAVAAHLEPEILIVDEVLAVGDAEFQKKAIGKMQEVSHQGGRTVLFVSHNMGSVKNLCDRLMILKDGHVKYIDGVESGINLYLQSTSTRVGHGKSTVDINFKGNEGIRRVEILNSRPGNVFFSNQPVGIKVLFEVRNISHIDLNISIWKGETKICMFFLSDMLRECKESDLLPGINEVSFYLPSQFLWKGQYHLNLLLHRNLQEKVHKVEESIFFEIQEANSTLLSKRGVVGGLVKVQPLSVNINNE